MQQNDKTVLPQTWCPYCNSREYDIVEQQPDIRYHPDEKFYVCKCAECKILFTAPILPENEIGKYYPDSYGAYAFKNNIDKIFDKIKHQPQVRNFPTDLLERYRKNLAQELAGKYIEKIFYRTANFFIAQYFNLNRKQPVPYYNKIPKTDQKKKYLHLGSGHPAIFAQYMYHDGYEVHNIDINKPICDAYRAVGVTSNYGTVTSAQYPENYFDYIYAGHVVEHFLHPREELKKLHSWLSENGVFICSFPLYETVEFSYKKPYYDVPRHTIHLTRKTAKMIFKDAGFAIEKISFPPYGWALQLNRNFYDYLHNPSFDHDSWNKPLNEKYYRISYLLSLFRQSGNPVYFLKKR
ncbi:MAG: class I SAM-dependent methyltransferase [Candidatus Auribacterota bacterium]|jgi:2-polyprenyl-3-methyl-5-hydroxy-6-metoxy-1,4-benzoquinol methylase|nr:class I SAM-dependent methyltransferase [Candidatus Auribacterota bacterium]